MKAVSGHAGSAKMTPQVIRSLIDVDASELGRQYLDRVRYLWGDKEFFIEKLPKNHLYVGFIAAAFPDSPIVWLRRNPMDACLAMFKQLFTGVYEFSYGFDDLARYYPMYDRLHAHWSAVLGGRIIEIEYENLVSDISAASTTASAIQVRQKVHSRSVLKWKNFASHLEPLRSRLEAGGIAT